MEEMIVAKLLYGADSDDMYGREDKKEGWCDKCGCRLDMIPNPNYKVRIKGRDFQQTYDDFYIVSDKFKRFCETNNYEGLIFFPIKTKGYYVFFATKIYKMAKNIGVVRYENLKKCCGSVNVEHNFWPNVYVRDIYNTKDGNDFIAQTDIMYGCKYRCTKLIIGIETYQKMKDSGLKGIDVRDVYSASYYLQHKNEFIKKQEEHEKFWNERLKKEKEYRRAHRWDFLINLLPNIGKGLLSLFRKRTPKIVYRYGKARPTDKVTLKNMQKYPIWVNEYVEMDTYEDNWTKPMLDTSNVTTDMESVNILMKEDELEIDVLATLDTKRMYLTDVLCWKPKTKEWEVINPIVEEKAKQWELKSIPLINGKENVVFVYDEKTNVFKFKGALK